MSIGDADTNRVRLDVLLVIAIGGVIGATARFALSSAVPTPEDGYPIATLATNVIGSFLLGFVAVISAGRVATTGYFRAFFMVGLIGSFTTFSAFAMENVELVDRGEVLVAAVYVPTMLASGLAAARLGIAAARRVADAGYE